MKKSEIITQVEKVYNIKGLNGVYAYLRKNSIKNQISVENFGLENKKTKAEKKEFLAKKEKNTLKFHYYSVGITSRKTHFMYYKLRAISIKIL